MLHSVVTTAETLQFTWILELMNKAWFRWNGNGFNNEDPLGIKMIEDDEQPTKNNFVIPFHLATPSILDYHFL